MPQQPLRVVMSRYGSDVNHDVLRDVHGVILSDPHVGELLKVYLDNGRFLVTTEVKRVEHEGEDLIVETANSTYRLHPDTN